MATIIQISDNQLLIKQNDSIAYSQGFAWLKGDRVYFDLDPQSVAIAHSRLKPQQINSHYWRQCDQTSVARNDSGMRYAADLIWQHLSQLKKQFNLADVIFIVPSHYQVENCQLLLGIAKSCKLNVVALFNRAVVESHRQIMDPGRYLHYDVQLHQTVYSTLIAEDGQLALDKMEVVHNVGLLAMQDSLLKAIQHNFIHNDRFDPLHNAQTEQQLFDQLPELANQISKTANANIVLNYQSRQHTANIDHKQWDTALQPFIDKLIPQRKNKAVFYSFNGFQLGRGTIQNLQQQTDSLIVDATLEHTEQQLLSCLSSKSQSNGQVLYVSQMPIDNAGSNYSLTDKSQTTVHGSSELHQGATHLLQSGLAVPLHQAVISTTNNSLKLHDGSVDASANLQTLLNKGEVFVAHDEQRKILKPNDRLASNLADGVITVIQVHAASEGNPER